MNFLSENVHFLVVKFSIYLNRHVFVKILFYFLQSFTFLLPISVIICLVTSLPHLPYTIVKTSRLSQLYKSEVLR